MGDGAYHRGGNQALVNLTNRLREKLKIISGLFCKKTAAGPRKGNQNQQKSN